ncbi:TonB-dependent receptor [Shewanella sp. NIFS-20-20]|uniref:TonB-dependent receptor n=1 Tax=Shewanella sp. NIFS-20-20 TaxID=2853806 RepID=UPI001C47630C|nr:TonB-dependent receptor [Shewanella sp. NIFS-20-20]MBV7315113.1 TonB-dependent receptor [Shewanella sp. NIFS-20-20]
MTHSAQYQQAKQLHHRTFSRMPQGLTPLALAISLAISSSALAKDEQTQEKAIKTKGIEVIEVQARHKVESLQSTPIAISAFSAEQIKESRVEGLNDIAERTPGFQMNAYSASEPELFMRGIGSDIESAGAAAAIGMYVDGVYISRGTGAAMDLFDLQSIEVLRGPQGTLYGKNVVGGAINFITRRPEFGDPTGSAELSLGNYGLWETKAFVTGGLSDEVAGKIAVSATSRDGYGQNLYTGVDADDLTRYSARGQLLWEASDDVDVLFTAGASTAEGTPRVKHIGYSEGRNAAFISDDPRRDYNSIDGFEDADSYNFSAQVDWFTSFGAVTSITAMRSNDYDFYENAAAGLVDRGQVFDPWGDPADNTVSSDAELAALQPDDEWLSRKKEASKQYSQEIRLAGDVEKWDWLAGVFWMREDISRYEDVDYWFHTQWGTTAGNVANTTESISDSYAVFGQLAYEFTDDFTVTAGLRWSQDDKDFSGAAWGRRFDNWDNLHEDLEGNRVERYDFSTSASWAEWTPSLNLEYQLNPDVFLYYSLAKGYKAGGFNGEGMEKAIEAITPFKPEIAWNNEVGFKTQGFEDKVRVNGAIFHTEYTDIQNQVWVETGENTPPNLQVMNGSGRAQGLELEAIVLITDQLSLNLGYGYLDAKFTEDLLVDDKNLNGNKMRRTPEHMFNINATYDWEWQNLGDASVYINYQYQDEYFFDNSNNPLTKVDAEFTLDLVLMLRDFNDVWSVQVWGKNLTDELNIGSTTLYTAWDDTVYNAYKAPRTFGVTLTYNF